MSDVLTPLKYLFTRLDDETAPGPSTAALEAHAHHVRELIVEMCSGGEGGHVGGSLSLVDILVTLYFDVMRIDPERPEHPERDLFVLSKGHGAIGLYATLAARGYLTEEQLATYGKPGSVLSAHPTRKVPGVEMPTGSLGHGLPLGVGFALGARLDGSRRRQYVVTGDGELQEGSNWEAAMAAGAKGLDNLVAVVDRNRLQITGSTEEVMGLDPLADRFRAFGWSAHEVDGHDIDALRAVLRAPAVPGRPTAIIANTVKGRGISFIEGQARSHYARLGESQKKRALSALRRSRREETAR
ncbi:transketolase [Streptomyces sp. NPDC058466]|uniref:transketolase n=1 Tax=Streptomyces sp. NPDC058466 TaxID=3346512 RepID=UPI00364DCF1F